MASCSFFCHTCNLTGSRIDSFKMLPRGSTPAFTDRCPRCDSEDLDIEDQDAKAHIQEQYNGPN